MALNYEILTAFVLATAALAISPGPDNIFVLTQSISHGRKYGLATTAGLITGCLVHTTLLAFGVSALIRDNREVFLLIRWFGACYMCYLAVRAYRDTIPLDLGREGPVKKNPGWLFRRGFVMNVLNPKVTVFFLAFFPGFLFSEGMPLVLQFYVLGGLFMAVSFLIFAIIAWLSGSISKFLTSRRGFVPVVRWLQVLVYSGIAAYLLLSDY